MYANFRYKLAEDLETKVEVDPSIIKHPSEYEYCLEWPSVQIEDGGDYIVKAVNENGEVQAEVGILV